MSSHRGAGVTAVATEKQPNSTEIKYGKRCHKINNTRSQINILAKARPTGFDTPDLRFPDPERIRKLPCAMWHVCMCFVGRMFGIK